MASFKKRGAAWRVWIDKRGVRESATFDTKREAAEWAARREAEIVAGVKGLKTTKTLHDAIDQYIKDVCPSHAGERWEKVRLNKIKREIPDVPLMTLSTDSTLADWRNKRMTEVQGASVRREMGLLRLVFEAAINEWKWIDENPLEGVKRPANGKPRTRFVSDAEVDAVVLALGYTGEAISTTRQIVAVAFLLSLETAMRSGEIVGLRWQDVDLERRVAHLVDTKNGDERHVPLSQRAVDLLRAMPKVEGDERIFRISDAVRDEVFREGREAAGLPNGKDGGFTFHDARATALTKLSKKLDILELARMVGHRDPRSLMIYYRESAEEIAKKL